MVTPHTVGGSSNLDIHAGNRKCTGSETNIFMCPLRAAELSGCSHSDDIGVHCMGTSVRHSTCSYVQSDLTNAEKAEIMTASATVNAAGFTSTANTPILASDYFHAHRKHCQTKFPGGDLAVIRTAFDNTKAMNACTNSKGL